MQTYNKTKNVMFIKITSFVSVLAVEKNILEANNKTQVCKIIQIRSANVYTVGF